MARRSPVTSSCKSTSPPSRWPGSPRRPSSGRWPSSRTPATRVRVPRPGVHGPTCSPPRPSSMLPAPPGRPPTTPSRSSAAAASSKPFAPAGTSRTHASPGSMKGPTRSSPSRSPRPCSARNTRPSSERPHHHITKETKMKRVPDAVRLTLGLFALGVFFQATARGDDSKAVVASEFVYETAPFASCHASTIAETPSRLVAAWSGGTREGDKDVGIWVSRRVGDRWTPPVEVANGIQADGTRFPCWNPVLFQALAGKAGGPLLLFSKVGPRPNSWWGVLQTSTDGGQTWSRPVRLPDGILGPIKNKPVRLAGGALLCPSSTEDDGWRVFL